MYIVQNTLTIHVYTPRSCRIDTLPYAFPAGHEALLLSAAVDGIARYIKGSVAIIDLMTEVPPKARIT